MLLTKNLGSVGTEYIEAVFYIVSLKQIRPSPSAKSATTSVFQDTTIVVMKRALQLQHF